MIDLLPTALELTCGIPFGTREMTPLEGRTESGGRVSARAALEESVLPALLRPPCVVSFSGGCDSSLVLAVATHVARREGLPDPVPVTNVFPDIASADEAAYQQLVIRHLGLDEWSRSVWRDGEVEVVGPHATDFLSAVGVRLPFNAHFHQPVFAQAQGGSVLTGIGGDDVLDTGERLATARLLRGRGPRKGHRRSAVSGLLPRRIRRDRQLRLDRFAAFSWLRAEAQAELEEGMAAWEVREPIGQDKALEWFARSRLVQLGIASRRALGAHHDVVSIDPILSVGFITSRAHELGFAGGTQRPATLRHLAVDLLPDRILDRRSKAAFNGAFYGWRSRAFAEAWDGRGVDSSLVDPEELKREWLRPHPDAHSLSLMQQAYVATASAPR